ncbi:uncharacterized protein LOC142163805 [Nicotiana tabacum]|uniref:Uncharacterized protein LOC142163805 n=1 Tax=Nicotiana tabacum TaxID=4097 RepID=A0AC58RWE9_TOBAC
MEFDLTDNELKNYYLQKLENFLKGCGRSFGDFPIMPTPTYKEEEVDTSNKLIRDELCYNRRALAEEHEELVKNLTGEQNCSYEKIITVVNENKGEFFFLYDFGGTCKTFIWRTLSSAIRSKGDIVLTVASSGIASLLLPGGRTAHSIFIISLNLTEDSTCNINQGTLLANLIAKAKLIIWDEAPIMHSYCFESLDRTLRDILIFKDASNLERPFGGKTVVLGGDFRQILHAILKDWIFAIGDGTIDNSVDGNEKVEIPYDLLIKDSVDPISAILENTSKPRSAYAVRKNTAEAAISTKIRIDEPNGKRVTEVIPETFVGSKYKSVFLSKGMINTMVPLMKPSLFGNPTII